MPTALEMTSEQRRRYKPVQASVVSGTSAAVKERRARAMRVAKSAAALLRDRFGATKVMVFGSLVSKREFTPWSDIDLAAWGIPAERYFAAVAAVTGVSAEFKVDLVDPETCRSSVVDSIQTYGMDL